MNNNGSSDPSWFKDTSILYNKKRLTEFVITKGMSFNEKINAILRFSIYSATILFLVKGDTKILLFPIFVAGLTMYLGMYRDRDLERMEHKNNPGPKCTMPTRKNPYMNVLMNEIEENPNRPPACDSNNPIVQAEINRHMNHNVYRNANDLYDENNFGRQFNTVPVTTVTQDEYEKFRNWVYHNPKKSCKEDTRNCKIYEDVRYNRNTN